MRSKNKWIGIVVTLQAAILLMLLGQGLTVVSPAKAEGIPDAGAQREQMIEQVKAANQKLDKLITLLSGGELRVKVTKLDDGTGK